MKISRQFTQYCPLLEMIDTNLIACHKNACKNVNISLLRLLSRENYRTRVSRQKGRMYVMRIIRNSGWNGEKQNQLTMLCRDETFIAECVLSFDSVFS